MFAGLAPLLTRSKALKSTNRPLYLVVKWSVNILLLLLLLTVLLLVLGLAWAMVLLIG